MILCTKCWDELFCIETNVTENKVSLSLNVYLKLCTINVIKCVACNCRAFLPENKVSLSLNKVCLTFSNGFQFCPHGPTVSPTWASVSSTWADPFTHMAERFVPTQIIADALTTDYKY